MTVVESKEAVKKLKLLPRITGAKIVQRYAHPCLHYFIQY